MSSGCVLRESLYCCLLYKRPCRGGSSKEIFGFTFTGGRPALPDYAVLRLSFDFNPVSENSARRMQLRLAKQTGFPVMLSSDHLIRIAIHRVMPKTPSSCRCEGVVQVRLLIDASGEVKCMEPGPGHPSLVYSALETLRQWRFQPFVHRGVPVPYTGELSVRFSAGRTGVFAK